MRTAFVFYALVGLIGALVFGITWQHIPDRTNVTMTQAQILFVSTIAALIGIVGVVQIIFSINAEEE